MSKKAQEIEAVLSTYREVADAVKRLKRGDLAEAEQYQEELKGAKALKRLFDAVGIPLPDDAPNADSLRSAFHSEGQPKVMQHLAKNLMNLALRKISKRHSSI